MQGVRVQSLVRVFCLMAKKTKHKNLVVLYLNDRENIISPNTGIDALFNSLFDSKDQKMDFPQLRTLERNH